jgi:glycosyltransferase involved in cell wall biosynthesis
MHGLPKKVNGMKIAVYTIAKNEEQFVERWASSAEGADYRFILDTGSTDDTATKARALGVVVATASITPWRFDDARNASLALLPADIDICIALDMDEVLVPGWREHLEGIDVATTRPRYQYTWSWNGDQPGLQYGADKIHARHGYRWKHPVHEVLVADRIEERQEWIGLEIHHHPDPTKSRGQYFPLLELAVKEDPTDDRNQYYLAREYFFNRMYDKALQMFKRHVSNPNATWGPERAASFRYMAKCAPENAENYLVQAIQEAPGRREAKVELARHYYTKQNWEECLDWAKLALLIETKPLDYLCEEFAWGELPYDLAAIAAYNLGDKDTALYYGEIALGFNPEDARLARNIGFYKS